MKKLNKVLFFGTGGGNDIFSTVLAILSLRQFGISYDSCDIGGVISPFHVHDVVSTDIPGAFITHADARRFINRKDYQKEISFIDSAVAEMAQAEKRSLRIGKVWSFSIDKGTYGLANTLKALFDRERYELLVLVDIGGDIFFRGKEDKHVLSPMFDAIVLRAAKQSGVPVKLFEAGLGTDGELEPEAFQQLPFLSCGKSLTEKSIVHTERLYNQWIRNIRPGRTVPMTIKAFRERKKADIIKMSYRARAHLGERREYVEFLQTISTKLASKCFLIGLDLIRNPFAVKCRSPYDWFIKTQSKLFTNNEANLEYWMARDNRSLQFLTPSPLFSEDIRHSLINEGVRDLKAGVYDRALMFEQDMEAFAINTKNIKTDKHKNNFVIVERR